MTLPPVILFHDFSLRGPYHGEMCLALWRVAPTLQILTLQADAPRCSPRPAAYLLSALAGSLPERCVVLAVVDPGVGSDRRGLVLVDEQRQWVGPDNGLLALIARSGTARAYQLPAATAGIPATFHGRDLFAPVAARLALGEMPDWESLSLSCLVGADWPAQLAEVIYIDDFGNCTIGLRTDAINHDATLKVGADRVGHARTFSDVEPGEPFWYANSSGLVEIAVNLGRADSVLGLRLGTAVSVVAVDDGA